MEAIVDVAVLGGGRSPEHEVSLQSAAGVLTHLDRTRWRPWPVAIGRDGGWSAAVEPAAAGEPFPAPSAPGLRPGAALDRLLDRGVRLVFPALHGRYGEDGTLQGMLELHDVAFVGSGSAASAVAMDKLRSRECFAAHGIPLAPAHVVAEALDRLDPAATAARIVEAVGLPCYVKIDWSGSSLGVVRATAEDEVATFLRDRAYGGRRVLAEREVVGEEISVPVLGNTGDELEALPPIGIYPVGDSHFSYRAKYEPGRCDEVVPPRGLDAAALAVVAELAIRCHRALCCDGLSRTDMIVGPHGPVVLETNTLPGLTPASLLPKAAAAAGITFAGLLDRLLDMALARRAAA